jgi:tetratricopeptide (TPR) repeat protein
MKLAPEALAPDSRAPERERLRAALREGAALASTFESRNALRSVSEALRLARRLRDPRAEAQSLVLATQCHYQRGDYVSAVATGLDACATYADNDLEGRSHVFHSVALAFFSVAEYRRAEEAARRAIRYASREHESLEEATARSTLAYVLCDSGQFDEALRELRRARARFRKLGDELRVKKATSNTGHVWRKRGIAFAAARDADAARRAWQKAMRYYRAALRIGRSRLDDAIILGSLGESALRLGRFHEAIAHLDAAAEQTGPRDAARIVAHIALRRGEAERALGRTEAAETHLRDAVERSRSLENDELGLEALEALARLCDDRGEGAQAREWREERGRQQASRRDALAAFRREMRPLWDHFLKGSDD